MWVSIWGPPSRFPRQMWSRAWTVASLQMSQTAASTSTPCSALDWSFS